MIIKKPPTIRTRRLQLGITESCDSKCVYCNFWKLKEPNYLSINDLEKLFSTIDLKNINLIAITGGEPTEHPEIEKLIEYVFKRSGIKLLLSTNCLDIPRLEGILAKTGSCLSTLSTSLDGPEHIHDLNRGVKGAFKNVMKGIGLAEHHNLQVKLAMTVLRSNIDQIPLMLEKYGDSTLDVKHIYTSQYYYGVNTEKKSMKHRNIAEELYWHLRNHYSHNDVTNLYNFYNAIYVMHGVRPMCTISLDELFVFPNKIVFACYQKEPLINLDTLNAEDFEKARINFIHKYSSCNDCFGRCGSSVVEVYKPYYMKVAREIQAGWILGKEFPERDLFDKIKNPESFE